MLFNRLWPSTITVFVIAVFNVFYVSYTQAMILSDKLHPNINTINYQVPISSANAQQPLSDFLAAPQPPQQQPPFSYRWLSVRPNLQDFSLHPMENDLGFLLQYLDKRGATQLLESEDEAQRDIRSPLGTMRFGKRATDLLKRNPLGTMRFGKRNPLGTMRFGKRVIGGEENL